MYFFYLTLNSQKINIKVSFDFLTKKTFNKI
jgi:hypothetical protein